MREEDLLGYLLNALDAAERRRVEEALEKDPQLRRQLQVLRQQLHPLESESFDPPEGLIDQTCDLVEGCYQQRHLCSSAGSSGERIAAPSRLWSLGDTIVAVGLFLAASMLFFPALANSRYRSQLRACQLNLQRLGTALRDFSDLNQGEFPAIPVSGRRATAGIYAPLLVDQGFVVDTRIFVCPGSELAQQIDGWRVPTLQEVDQADDRLLSRLRRAMGGSYGYPLGYRIQDRCYSPRNEGRSFFALMSDAPSLHLAGRRSSNHCGRGQNVMFEDLHVEFVVDPVEVAPRNSLYVNREGVAEAGTDKDDFVIGGSATPPLLAPVHLVSDAND
jgi:hypothetical protein